MGAEDGPRARTARYPRRHTAQRERARHTHLNGGTQHGGRVRARAPREMGREPRAAGPNRHRPVTIRPGRMRIGPGRHLRPGAEHD